MIFKRDKDAWQTITLLEFLGEVLSEVSEQAFAAGWTQGTEYFIPGLCQRARMTNRNISWGRSFITPMLADRLFHVSADLHSWVDYENPDRFVPFSPFPIPEPFASILAEQSDIVAANALPPLSKASFQNFRKSPFSAKYLQDLELSP